MVFKFTKVSVYGTGRISVFNKYNYDQLKPYRSIYIICALAFSKFCYVRIFFSLLERSDTAE